MYIFRGKNNKNKVIKFFHDQGNTYRSACKKLLEGYITAFYNTIFFFFQKEIWVCKKQSLMTFHINENNENICS